MQYKVTNKEKHTEVEIDNDFETYIALTYVSDKLIEKLGMDTITSVISDLIEYGAINTDDIERDDGYDEYMHEHYCNEISDLEDEEVENRKAWEETLASLPR